MLKDCFSSIVQPKTLPPKAKGRTFIPEVPISRFSIWFKLMLVLSDFFGQFLRPRREIRLAAAHPFPFAVIIFGDDKLDITVDRLKAPGAAVVISGAGYPHNSSLGTAQYGFKLFAHINGIKNEIITLILAPVF